MVLAIGETGIQNVVEAVGDGEHQDNGEWPGEDNDRSVEASDTVATGFEEVVLKGARFAGDSADVVLKGAKDAGGCEEFGGGQAMIDEKGNMVLPAPAHGSVAHWEQGRLQGLE